MRLRATMLAALVLGLAAACSGEEEGTSGPPTATSPGETEATPGTTTEPSAEPLRLRLVRVASGFESPLDVVAAPGEEDRLYVVEREGRIRVLERGQVLEEPFLDIADRVTSGGEQGLLSVAFHPDYPANRLFYVDYTDRAGDTRVVEYRAVPDSAPRRVRELLVVDQPYANHNGGQLQFGPDGLLYVGMGDGGGGGDPENRAQDLSSRLGKLLSLDVNGPGAQWRTVAYGLRNPWRFSFDRETGDLYIADVGQSEREEIDYLPAGTHGLVNFGWDVFEGHRVYEDKEPNSAGRLLGPVVEYSHEHGCSVTGGYVYRGEDLPAARGRYFYGDYCSGAVWSIRVRGGRSSHPRRLRFEVDSLASFGEDGRGELYLVSLDGAIFRLAGR